MPVEHVRLSCIFRALAWLEQFIQAFSIIFRHIQGYWCIFSHTHRRATRVGMGWGVGWGGGSGRLPLIFLKIEKMCPDFWKKGPDCVHLWIKFSIQNVVLRASRRKSTKLFPVGSLFLLFSKKSLFKCPIFTPYPLPHPCPETFFTHTCTEALFFFQEASS